MNTNNSYETIYLNRITAIVLLVRLENADIPYPHSKKCRHQLIHFLASILTDEDRSENILKIDCEELSKYIEDIEDSETAIKIMKCYSEFK